MENPFEIKVKAKKVVNWESKYKKRESKIRSLIEENRALHNTIDLLSKKSELIDKYIDVFTRTHLQAHWHKTKCHSANRKVLLELDSLFKQKTGYSWINKHIKNCTHEICIEYKEGLQ